MSNNSNKKIGLGRVTNPTNAPRCSSPQGSGRVNTLKNYVKPSGPTVVPTCGTNTTYKWVTKDKFPVRPQNWNTRFYDYTNAADYENSVVYPMFANGWPYWYNTPIDPGHKIALYDQQNEYDIAMDNVAYVDRRYLSEPQIARLKQLEKVGYLKDINKKNFVVENFANGTSEKSDIIFLIIVIIVIILFFRNS